MKVAGVRECADISSFSVDSFWGGIYSVWSVCGSFCMICTVLGC